MSLTEVGLGLARSVSRWARISAGKCLAPRGKDGDCPAASMTTGPRSLRFLVHGWSSRDSSASAVHGSVRGHGYPEIVEILIEIVSKSIAGLCSTGERSLDRLARAAPIV